MERERRIRNKMERKTFFITYDIILLSECWIGNHFDISVDGYSSICVPRKTTRCKQGGGIVILIKDAFAKHVYIKQIVHDTLVVLFIDKFISLCNADMFCIFNYIPPRSSKYFRKYNVDLFYELESLVSHYAALGKVFALGDFKRLVQHKQIPLV